MEKRIDDTRSMEDIILDFRMRLSKVTTFLAICGGLVKLLEDESVTLAQLKQLLPSLKRNHQEARAAILGGEQERPK